MSLLKQCCHILAPAITNIVNLSLSTGEFPSQFKQAIVTLLIKKPSLEENHSLTTGQSLIFPFSQNSLSVSSRTAFTNTCRITPCSIFSNLPTQSFIPLNLLYWWSMTISLKPWTDSKSPVLLYSITIDHSILLHRLTSWFGICDSAITWFESYLSNRSFSVSCLDNLSSSLPLSCGVPQSSFLVPILFIMYTTPLSSLISQTAACHKSLVDHHLYADDTNYSSPSHLTQPKLLLTVSMSH